MRCPQCEGDFGLTLRLYLLSPRGRFNCPLCGTRVVARHTWFYPLWYGAAWMSAAATMGYLALELAWGYEGIAIGLAVSLPVFILLDWRVEAATSQLEILPQKPAPHRTSAST